MFLTYHTVPKTYLAVKDRELVSDPTNRSARNGQNTKSFNMARLLTTARDWHRPFTPAHRISQNRPKQSGLSIDIFIYKRVDLLVSATDEQGGDGHATTEAAPHTSRMLPCFPLLEMSGVLQQ